jgi:hypothetical protein
MIKSATKVLESLFLSSGTTNLIAQVCTLMNMLGFKQLGFTMVYKCHTARLIQSKNSGCCAPLVDIQFLFCTAKCHEPVTTYFSMMNTAYRRISVNCVFFSSWAHID